ncbi:hypothetical protein ACPC54_19485 [Kitasatospora sp. NPDC094028]
MTAQTLDALHAEAPKSLLTLADKATANGWTPDARRSADRWVLTLSALIRTRKGLAEAELRAVWSAANNRFDAGRSWGRLDGGHRAQGTTYRELRTTVEETPGIDRAAEAADITVQGLDAAAWSVLADQHAERAEAAHFRAEAALTEAQCRREPWAAAAEAAARSEAAAAGRTAGRASLTARAAEAEDRANAERTTPSALRAAELAGRARALADRAQAAADRAASALADAEGEHLAAAAHATAQAELDRQEAAAIAATPTITAREFARDVIQARGGADGRFADWHATHRRTGEGYGAAWDRWCAERREPPRAETRAWLAADDAELAALFSLGVEAAQCLDPTTQPGADLLRWSRAAQALLERGQVRGAGQHVVRVREALAGRRFTSAQQAAEEWAVRCPVQAEALRRAILAKHGIDNRRALRHRAREAADERG